MSREVGLLIDGRQRLTTLAWFIKGILNEEKSTFRLRGEGIRKTWANKNFEDLDEKHRDNLLRSYIPVTYVRQLTDDTPKLPNASSLYVLFDRLNSGGYTLHPHEKRSVLITHNESYEVLQKFIKSIYNLSEWKDVIKSVHKDSDDYRYTTFAENIFRLYPFCLYIDMYGGVLAKFLDTFMINYKMTEEMSEKLFDATKASLRTAVKIKELVDGKLFLPFEKFNVAFYEMFMVALIRP